MNYGGGKPSVKYTNKGIVEQRNGVWKKAVVTVAAKEKPLICIVTFKKKKWVFVNLSLQLQGKDIKSTVIFLRSQQKA
jgi:hypothetical protein